MEKSQGQIEQQQINARFQDHIMFQANDVNIKLIQVNGSKIYFEPQNSNHTIQTITDQYKTFTNKQLVLQKQNLKLPVNLPISKMIETCESASIFENVINQLQDQKVQNIQCLNNKSIANFEKLNKVSEYNTIVKQRCLIYFQNLPKRVKEMVKLQNPKKPDTSPIKKSISMYKIKPDIKDELQQKMNCGIQNKQEQAQIEQEVIEQNSISLDDQKYWQKKIGAQQASEQIKLQFMINTFTRPLDLIKFAQKQLQCSLNNIDLLYGSQNTLIKKDTYQISFYALGCIQKQYTIVYLSQNCYFKGNMTTPLHHYQNQPFYLQKVAQMFNTQKYQEQGTIYVQGYNIHQSKAQKAQLNHIYKVQGVTKYLILTLKFNDQTTYLECSPQVLVRIKEDKWIACSDLIKGHMILGCNAHLHDKGYHYLEVQKIQEILLKYQVKDETQEELYLKYKKQQLMQKLQKSQKKSQIIDNFYCLTSQKLSTLIVNGVVVHNRSAFVLQVHEIGQITHNQIRTYKQYIYSDNRIKNIFPNQRCELAGCILNNQNTFGDYQLSEFGLIYVYVQEKEEVKQSVNAGQNLSESRTRSPRLYKFYTADKNLTEYKSTLRKHISPGKQQKLLNQTMTSQSSQSPQNVSPNKKGVSISVGLQKNQSKQRKKIVVSEYNREPIDLSQKTQCEKSSLSQLWQRSFMGIYNHQIVSVSQFVASLDVRDSFKRQQNQSSKNPQSQAQKKSILIGNRANFQRVYYIQHIQPNQQKTFQQLYKQFPGCHISARQGLDNISASAIRLYTQPTEYQELNRFLYKDYSNYFGFNSFKQDQKQMLSITKWINQSISLLPDTKGKLYRGMCNIDLGIALGINSGNQLITMNSFTSTSADMNVAKNFSNQQGAILTFKVQHGKSIEKFSKYQKEKQILIPPFTCFSINSCNLNSKPQTAELQQIPLPKTSSKNIIFWVDDEPEQNRNLYETEQFFQQNKIQVVQVTSTKIMTLILKNYFWIYKMLDKKIMIISDMVRIEDGQQNYYAGADLFRQIYIEYGFSTRSVIFAGKKKRAMDNLVQRGVNSGNWTVKVKAQSLLQQIKQFFQELPLS